MQRTFKDRPSLPARTEVHARHKCSNAFFLKWGLRDPQCVFWEGDNCFVINKGNLFCIAIVNPLGRKNSAEGTPLYYALNLKEENVKEGEDVKIVLFQDDSKLLPGNIIELIVHVDG
eukprot:7064556-Ditylum_brightwellii.AAC.1